MAAAYDLSKLIKWLVQDDWRSLMEEVIEEHFGPAMEAFDLEFEEIDEALGGTWGRTLWSRAFEDVLTRRRSDGQNPVEAYLQRRGWTESTGTKRYLTALQASVMSLYEVSDLNPGQSFRARDLIRGGEPVLVSERSASRTLKPWDRIAARIVAQGDQLILAGGILAFTLEGSELLITGLNDPDKPGRRKGAKRSSASPSIWTGTDDELRLAAPLFTTSWLFDALTRALGINPSTLHNSDGDELVFHDLTFPFAGKASAKAVSARVDALPELRRENPTYWNWVGPPPPPQTTAEEDTALRWNMTLEDGSVVLGAVELKHRTLVLYVNSEARAERGRIMLADALAGLVGPPLTKIQTLDQARAEHGDRPAPPAPDIPAEVQTELVHKMLDKQYRAVLDQPVGALGDISPRAASRSVKGREKVAAWLKHLENRSSHAGDRSDPMATYDFTWLWRELKVEQLRN